MVRIPCLERKLSKEGGFCGGQVSFKRSFYLDSCLSLASVTLTFVRSMIFRFESILVRFIPRSTIFWLQPFRAVVGFLALVVDFHLNFHPLMFIFIPVEAWVSILYCLYCCIIVVVKVYFYTFTVVCPCPSCRM